MRVAQLDFSEPETPVSLVEIDPPALPNPDWARVAVTGGGICGSDLHIFRPTTGPTPALVSYATLPIEMGHEIAGTVTEAGPDCPVPPGSRVAVDPVIACVARAIDPVCDRCAEGAASACRNVGSRVLTPGMVLGYTNGLGAGWADALVAHHTQLHEIPETVTRRSETLAEPLSIAVHGLLRTPPEAGHVLVVGAGIIGLLATVAVRSLFPDCVVTVVAKHGHQADAARACGAHRVVDLSGLPGDDPTALHAELADASGTTVRGTGDDAMLDDGFPYVVEAVGSEEAVTLCLRSVDRRGHVLVLGAAGVSTVDLTPVWFKEATLAGSFCHATDAGPGDVPAHSFDRAIRILASGAVPDSLVTHEFPLDDYEAAISTALDRASGAIKVVLRP